MTSPFDRERQTLKDAQQCIVEGRVNAQAYQDLAIAYRKLLRQSEKIVRIGDATQNKLLRARRMLERGIQFYRKNAENQQRKAEQSSELVNLLSHDMKNRAAPFRILVDSLLEEIPHPSPEALETLELISTAADRMLVSIDMALDRRNDAVGDIIPVFEKVDAVTILAETIQDVAVSAQRKEISLKVAGEASLEVEADPFLLGEIFENIIGNAVKYSYPNTPVSIALHRANEGLCLTVEDRGQGFTAEDLQHVFQPYTTLSAKPTGNEKATGLGLSIVKKLVDLHRGKVSVQSNGVGQGALFTVELPLSQPA